VNKNYICPKITLLEIIYEKDYYILLDYPYNIGGICSGKIKRQFAD
jgi:hypothetical protein